MRTVIANWQRTNPGTIWPDSSQVGEREDVKTWQKGAERAERVHLLLSDFCSSEFAASIMPIIEIIV